MPERRDTNLFEILIGQVTQNLEVNIILGKALSVLPETKLFEPLQNLLHRRPSTDLTLSVLDRHVAEFINTRQDRVARARCTLHRTIGIGSGSLDSSMSALPPKADIAEFDGDVRFVPKADSATLFDPRCCE